VRELVETSVKFVSAVFMDAFNAPPVRNVKFTIPDSPFQAVVELGINAMDPLDSESVSGKTDVMATAGACALAAVAAWARTTPSN
jgi:hypothetical protein